MAGADLAGVFLVVVVIADAKTQGGEKHAGLGISFDQFTEKGFATENPEITEKKSKSLTITNNKSLCSLWFFFCVLMLRLAGETAIVALSARHVAATRSASGAAATSPRPALSPTLRQFRCVNSLGPVAVY